MKKQTEEISKKYDFFIDNDDKKDVKIKFDDKKNSMKIEVDDYVERIPYLSPQNEIKKDDDADDEKNSMKFKQTMLKQFLSPKNEIKKDDDADTILYTSLYNSPKCEVDGKIYVEPKLETIEEIEEKTAKKTMRLLSL